MQYLSFTNEICTFCARLNRWKAQDAGSVPPTNSTINLCSSERFRLLSPGANLQKGPIARNHFCLLPLQAKV